MPNLMISSTELAEILQIPVRQAAKVIREVNKELSAKGIYVFDTRPPKAPRQEVMKRIGVKE